jgi:hypothetical protein
MPMGSYQDFDDCVAKNKDKDDPQAYCGAIKHKVEKSENVIHKQLGSILIELCKSLSIFAKN